MRKTIIAFILLVCVILSFAFLLSACESDEPEWRTYHKVYKDSNGEWQGKDVTYDAHVEGGTFKTIVAVVIVVIIYVIVKKGKKS